jgi:ligand-binding SRPBCC domain-containing protein
MTDTVHYAMPYGVLGLAARKLVVAKRLEQIFEFRRQKLIEFFK